MTSLRLLPIDVMKEIVSYLDFDTCSILCWTLDRRIERIFSAGAISRLEVDCHSAMPFCPAHRHLIDVLNSLEAVAIQTSSDEVLQPRFLGRIAKLAPTQLILRICFMSCGPHVFNCCAHFKSLQVLQVALDGISGEVVRFCMQLPGLPDLKRLHLAFNSDIAITRDKIMGDCVREAIQLFPEKLVELELSETQEYHVTILPLAEIFAQLPELEKLTLKRIYGVLEEGVELPASLTSLSLHSIEELLAGSPESLLKSNVASLYVFREVRLKHMVTQVDLEKLLPVSLRHLELPRGFPFETLPTSLTHLKVEPKSHQHLRTILERLLFPLRSLHSLWISIPMDTLNPEPIATQLPNSLHQVTVSSDCSGLSPETLRLIFGSEFLDSVPNLDVQFEQWTNVSLKALIAFGRACPRFRIEVKYPLRLQTEEISQILEIPSIAPVLVDFEPGRLLVAIAEWLCSIGRFSISICMCVACVGRLLVGRETKHITLPAASMGKSLSMEYKGVKLIRCSRTCEQMRLPNSVESFGVSSFDVAGRDWSVSAPRGRGDYGEYSEMDFLGPLESSNLMVLDLAEVRIRDKEKFWNSLPRSLTHLRSTHDAQPEIKLGRVAKIEPLAFSNVPGGFLAPFDLSTLDTPYYTYSVVQLTALCPRKTLTSLYATITGLDTEIFGCGLGTVPLPFPHLKTLKLRAFPIVTGLLMANYPTHASPRVLEREVVEVLQSANVHVVGCTFANSLALHPRVTHLFLRDEPCRIFSRVEYHTSDLNRVQELKINFEPRIGNAAPTRLVLPPSLSLLDLSMKLQDFFDLYPRIPTSLRHLSLVILDPAKHFPRTSAVLKDVTLRNFPMELESIHVDGILPSLIPQELAPPVPHLASFSTNSANDYYLESLCLLLPKATKVKADVAFMTCQLLPSNLVEFSWMAAFFACLKLEAQFPNLEIVQWRTNASEMQLKSECLKVASFNLDISVDWIFGPKTHHRKPSYMPLVRDVIELQETSIIPIQIPNTVEHLECCISRLLFQDADLKPQLKSTRLLNPKWLFRRVYIDTMKFTNLTRMTLRLPTLPDASELSDWNLPLQLEVLDVAFTGNPRKDRKIAARDAVRTLTPKLREIIIGPFIDIDWKGSGPQPFKIVRKKR